MFQRTSAKTVNIVVLVILCLLGILSWQRSNAQLLVLFASGLGLLASLFNYWRLLKITEAPISTIAAAAQGYVELQGRASTQKPLATPFHGVPCVWYRAWVYANIKDDNLFQSPVSMRLLDYVESSDTFQLNDETGACAINPIGAEVIFFQMHTWRKNDHRYVEQYLPAGKSLYVIGQLDSRKDVLDTAAFNRDLSAKLAEWKSRPQRLLHLYDHNRDGRIDMQEWELARQDATASVKAEQAMHANLGSFTLHKPSDKHMFIISAKSPHELRSAHKFWAWLYFGFFCLG